MISRPCAAASSLTAFSVTRRPALAMWLVDDKSNTTPREPFSIAART